MSYKEQSVSATLLWDDVKEGTEIPSLVKHPTTRMLVKYAGRQGTSIKYITIRGSPRIRASPA